MLKNDNQHIYMVKIGKVYKQTSKVKLSRLSDEEW